MQVTQASIPGVAEIPWVPVEDLRLRNGKRWTLFNTLVENEADLVEMGKMISEHKERAYDTETSGLRVSLGARICGHSIAVAYPNTRHIRAWYVPTRHQMANMPQLAPEVAAKHMQPLLQDCTLFGHNLKFDVAMARADGITVSADWHDTATMATVHDENEHSFRLKTLTEKYVYVGARDEEMQLDKWMRKDASQLKMRFKKRDTSEEDPIGKPTYLEHFGYSRAPITLCGRYACHDVAYTLLLKDFLCPRIFPNFNEVYMREMAVARYLHEMEWGGQLVDPNEIRRASDLLLADVQHWTNEIKRLTNWQPTDDVPEFVINDNTLRELFYGKLQLTPPKYTKEDEKPSTDKEARSILEKQYPQHAPLLKAISARAKSKKLHSTYAASFLRFVSPESRLHPSYNQIEAKDEGGVPRTGRLNSQDPNFQNVAKKPIKLHADELVSIRRYFLVPDGFVRAYIDLSQIELRVLAWLSQDPVLLHCYANNMDVHAITAEQVTGGDRDVAKRVNFGNNYGQTEIGLAKHLKNYADDPEQAREDAKRYLEGFFQVYAGVPRYRDWLTQYMQSHDNMFVSHFNRPRRLPDISSSMRWEVERAQRQMMSSIVSGTAADMIKEIILRTGRILSEQEPRAKMVGTIHDEVIYDLPIQGCARLLPELVRAFTSWPDFEAKGVPIRASVELTKTTWEEKRPIELLPDGNFQWAA